ncbi:MAG: hypothetical protein ACE366_23925 [Bradymonadia bacterium]
MKTEGFSPVTGLDLHVIELGSSGIHFLFAPEIIRAAFASIEQDGIDARCIRLAHQALRSLSSLEDPYETHTHLQSLDDRVLYTVVFLYFRTLDQYMAQGGFTLH